MNFNRPVYDNPPDLNLNLPSSIIAVEEEPCYQYLLQLNTQFGRIFRNWNENRIPSILTHPYYTIRRVYSTNLEYNGLPTAG